MQRIFLHWILLVFCFKNSAAQNNMIKPLEIGEYMPDISFENIVADGPKEKTFRQMKGKLVILDFWNVQCKGCLHAMPHLDTLQKNFRDKLKIILVTKNKQKDIDDLFSRIKINFPYLASITEDTLLNELFPHEGEPFQAWIDPDGKVRYLTSDYNATQENISKVLAGSEVGISNFQLQDSFDSNRPLINQASSSLTDLVDSYSFLVRGLQNRERNTIIRIEKDSLSKKVTRITAINISILSLFNLAFNNSVYGYDKGTFRLDQNNRVAYEFDPEKLFVPRDFQLLDEWKNKNLVSYEIKVSQDSPFSIYDLMQQDINKYFAIEGSVEKKKIRCLVLIDSLAGCIGTKGGEPKIQYLNKQLSIQNQPLASLARELAFQNNDLNLPVVDGTTRKQNVDVILDANLNDVQQLRKALRKYGLDLMPGEREVNVLVLSKKK